MKPLGAFGPGGDLLKLHVGAIGPTRKKISLEIPTIFLSKFLTVFLPQKSMGSSPRLLSFGWNCVHLFHFFNSRSNFGLIISHRPARSLFVDFCTFSQSRTSQKNIKKTAHPFHLVSLYFPAFVFSVSVLISVCWTPN